MLKLIVTGAFSTGKTTLINSLADVLAEMGITAKRTPDVARNCPVPLNSSQTESASLWLIATQIAREIEAAIGPEQVMLCDRGIPDILSHQAEVREAAGSGHMDLLDGFLTYWINTYDLILFSRVDETIQIQKDNLRQDDAAYRTLLDTHVDKILTGHENVYELPKDNEDRLVYALDLLQKSLDASRELSNRSI